MSKVIPFPALIPSSDAAAEVLCPPYDVIDSSAARALAAGKAYSLLHITKPEIDLPPELDEYNDAVYAKGAENLSKFRDEGTLVRDVPSFYIYRLISSGYTQTGIVAGVSAEEYGRGLIKKHEKTREPKVVDRTRLARAIRAHAEPVFLVHRKDAGIAEIVKTETAGTPLFDITYADGVRHVLWRVSNAEAVRAAFEHMNALYIADGHHRSETGFRTYEEMRRENPEHTGEEPYCFFPAVIFPEDEMRIFQYDWDGPAGERPLAKVTMADVIKLADENGIMPPKSTWFAPKLISGLFLYTF
jgi:uncharacterized protein (DUF1015 family)